MKKAFAYLRLVSSIALAVVFVAGLIVGTLGYYARFGKAKLTFLNDIYASHGRQYNNEF